MQFLLCNSCFDLRSLRKLNEKRARGELRCGNVDEEILPIDVVGFEDAENGMESLKNAGFRRVAYNAYTHNGPEDLPKLIDEVTDRFVHATQHHHHMWNFKDPEAAAATLRNHLRHNGDNIMMSIKGDDAMDDDEEDELSFLTHVNLSP